MRTTLLAGVCVILAGTAGAEEDGDVPDADLLEFLGSWEGEDDTWQAMIDAAARDSDKDRRAMRDETESGDD